MFVEEYTYYIRLNEDDDVIAFFNSIFETPLSTDIYYQRSTERNLQLELMNEYGQYLYYYDGNDIIEKTLEQLDLLTQAKEQKLAELEQAAFSAVDVYYPSYVQTNIINRIGFTDEDFIIMSDFMNQIDVVVNIKTTEINAQETVEAVEAVVIDVFGEIEPAESTDIPEDEINRIAGGYTIKKILTLSEDDVSNGYVVLEQKADGDAGEKQFVQFTPIGCLQQEYGDGFTAMNDDANENLVAIFTTTGEIPGIESPVYPEEPYNIFEAGEKLKLLYR